MVTNRLSDKHVPTIVKAINGYKVRLYRKYNIQISLKDYNNKEISSYTLFQSIDIEEFSIILGYLQLVKDNLDIYQADSIQYFRPERKLLRIRSEEIELIYNIKEFIRLVTLVVKSKVGEAFLILTY